MFSLSDTIVAIATPPGRGGIGIVRLSGPSAPLLACQLLQRERPLRPRHATFGHVRSGSERADLVDQVVVTWFERPRSYTAEDVVEIGAHGNPVVLGRILELAVRAGARLAEPGEFTLRAHLNGRLDLVQAEAVCDLVAAVTPLQARAAMDQLEGTLTTEIGRVDGRLFDLCARLEASLDFPDEGFHFITRDEAIAELTRVRDDLAALVRDGRAGRLIREGSMVVIVGRPNAGKSSLFNALVGSERAIVTAVAGTTRDLLTEAVDVLGLPLTFVDTAGLRDTDEAIELEGVRRARQAHQVAALTLLVLDGSQPLDDDDWRLLDETAQRARLIVVNKIDLPSGWSANDTASLPTLAVPVSAIDGRGLDDLRRRIAEALTGRDEWRDPPAISNTRHLGHVEAALGIIVEAARALAAGAAEELVLAELAAARTSLEAITGVRTSEDVLRHIFTRFCVGK